MRSTIIVSVLALGLLLAASVGAGEAGRYQGIAIGERLFVVDTQDGHVWTVAPEREEVRSKDLIIYQGRVRPGEEFGEVIEQLPAPVGGPGKGVIRVLDEKGGVVREINREMGKSPEQPTSKQD